MSHQLDAVKAAVAEALGDAYDCTRVWSAWSYNTMGPDDFVLVSDDDERLTEIVDAALEALPKATNNRAAEYWHARYREATQAYNDRAAAQGARLAALDAHNNRLLRALACAIEFVGEPPEANCSCHLAPPCNDCVEHAGARELLEILRSAEVAA